MRIQRRIQTSKTMLSRTASTSSAHMLQTSIQVYIYTSLQVYKKTSIQVYNNTEKNRRQKQCYHCISKRRSHDIAMRMNYLMGPNMLECFHTSAGKIIFFISNSLCKIFGVKRARQQLCVLCIALFASERGHIDTIFESNQIDDDKITTFILTSFMCAGSNAGIKGLFLFKDLDKYC